MNFILSLIANHKKKILVVLALAVIAIGSKYILGPDNPVEDGAEKIIQEETGFDIDFSPENK